MSKCQSIRDVIINNWTTRRFPSYFFLYFLFIFYFPRCTLPYFSSVSSLSSKPFLSCCHQTKTINDMFWSFFVALRDTMFDRDLWVPEINLQQLFDNFGQNHKISIGTLPSPKKACFCLRYYYHTKT